MDKVFVAVNEYSFSSRDMYDVNDFLEKNPNYTITSIVPISQYMGGETIHREYYGVVIVVSDKK